MKPIKRTILIAFTSIYLLMVFFTSISLNIAFKKRIEIKWVKISIRSISVLNALVVYGLVIINLVNPFAWNNFSVESFYSERVDGRIFNAYFRPVGAYAGGEGNFWITEIPKFLPFIEIEKFHDNAVLWDFRATEWEGEPVNQNEVVKDYIKDNVLAKDDN
ncbi:hypothetical protein [Fulvivirga ligni]|uniref:hypothetical protein n=1 Tax=Fulvivirga ligni TaxID=2904246 RepID=UPI001F28F6C9|nr:hypothetical protein [Fulvivirga ligni]UII22319.1 hypothetical protein LVD16_03630 [Fulvivirga ligni]